MAKTSKSKKSRGAKKKSTPRPVRKSHHTAAPSPEALTLLERISARLKGIG